MFCDEFYTRNKQNCYEINTNSGLSIYELLGTENGDCSFMSIALEEFAQGGHSPAHYHTKSNEYQVVLEGCGEMIIGDEKITITAGDLVKIPKGKVHQTFNKHKEILKTFCFLAPSWSSKDTIYSKNESLISEENISIYQRRKEECKEIDTGKGEFVYELLGKDNGNSEDLSIAFVEINGECSTEAHYHPKAVEAYIILEGEGRLVIDGKIKIVVPGDLAKIPMGKVHQIFNDKKETLKFYCACTPSWTPKGMIKI